MSHNLPAPLCASPRPTGTIDCRTFSSHGQSTFQPRAVPVTFSSPADSSPSRLRSPRWSRALLSLCLATTAALGSFPGSTLFAAAPSTTTVASVKGSARLDPNLREVIRKRRSIEGQGLRAARLAGSASESSAGPVWTPEVYDAEDRVLVSITLNGQRPLAEVRKTISSAVRVTGVDEAYRKGVIDGYLDLSKASQVAETPGVESVRLSIRPITKVGRATTAGRVQHRVDKILFTGQNVKIGVISDSFNRSSSQIKEKHDIASGDLPGVGNPNGRTTPVQIIDDSYTGTTESPTGDEGRAMLQIIHDIAPGSKLAFATGFTGTSAFANNIRALAKAGCNIIVDDIGLIDTPFFADAQVGQAIDEVVNAGVSYFSAAGNIAGTSAYQANFRIVTAPAPGTKLPGTNCTLPAADELDPRLYAGGFHNFSPTGTDLAQSVLVDRISSMAIQWDDPFDAPITVGSNLYTTKGVLTASVPTRTYTFNGTAGQKVRFSAVPDAAATNPISDLVMEVSGPDGTLIETVDLTDVTAEELSLPLPATGAYKVKISGFRDENASVGALGAFIFKVDAVTGELVTTDLNVFFFDQEGKYLNGFATNNFLSTRPLEISKPDVTASQTVQVVIARANKPATTPKPASLFRMIWYTTGSVAEYSDPRTRTIAGHEASRGAITVAGYPFFAPFQVDSIGSQGPVFILFDSQGRRLATPEYREKPDIAAMTGANTTFFGEDSTKDTDDQRNFIGTSSAAPHAAAIGALVMEAKGGASKVKPWQMRTILRQSAFKHDLDPHVARGSAAVGGGTLTITARANEKDVAQAYTDVFTVEYTGSGKIRTLKIDLTSANPTQTPAGLVFDPRPVGGRPLTLGTLTGLTANQITPVFFNASTKNSSVFRTLEFRFATGSFGGGDVLRFTVDRDEADTLSDGGSASSLGAGVVLPSGEVKTGAARFSGTMEDGSTFSGTITNSIGTGFTSADGYGFIDAKVAVELPLP